MSSSDLKAVEARAHDLASTMPELMVEAARVAHTVAQGLHGRHRAGPGETFWQFRHHQQGDSATAIDWRRSAATDHLFVREREWEAAHTVWLWPDISSSMMFQSHLSKRPKRDRALLLSFALSELLTQSGERVGLIGLRAPVASRSIISRLGETLARYARAGEPANMPPNCQLNSFSEALFLSDFLAPLTSLIPRIKAFAAQGVRGHLLQILDPAEETLPYSGRLEFRGPEGTGKVLLGRTETVREKYRERMAAHRLELEDHLKRAGWSFLVHHTDRPASEPLLALMARLMGGAR